MSIITQSLLQPRQANTDIIKCYLSEIGRIPMLTPEQETIYARQVEQMMNLLNQKEKLGAALNRPPTQAEWATYCNLSDRELSRIVQLGQRAKQKMVQANLRLVVSVAKQYRNRNMELLDLIQEGSIGLQRGIEKFDPSKGYKLSTYAYWWIRQAITRAIAQQSRAIRLPVHAVEKLNRIKKAQQKLSQSLGRNPTVTELGDFLALDPRQVQILVQQNQKVTSLDRWVGKEQDTVLIDLIPDEGITPEEAVDHSISQAQFKNLFDQLPPMCQQVLTLRFGLEAEADLSLREIGNRLHLSRERVRQIEKEAIAQLRKLVSYKNGQLLYKTWHN